MINQIEIASEQKDSNLASTLAHETRKNNAGRKLFLSLCVMVAIAGATIITACNGDKDDDPSTLATSVVTSINAEVAGVNSSVTSVRLLWWVWNDEEERNTPVTVGQSTFSNGRFNINLSEISVPAHLLVHLPDFNPGMTFSNPNAEVVAFESLVAFDANDQPLGEFIYSNTERGIVGVLTFSNNDVIISGTSTDTMEDITYTSVWNNASLKRGWNFIYSSLRISGATRTYTNTSSNPGDMKWEWIEGWEESWNGNSGNDDGNGGNDDGNGNDDGKVSIGTQAAREMCECAKLIEAAQAICMQTWLAKYDDYVEIIEIDEHNGDLGFKEQNFENDFWTEYEKCSN